MSTKCTECRSSESTVVVGIVAAVELVRGLCGRCGASWVGESRCHCQLCCSTFDDVELFDAHRANGACRDGSAMGLNRTRNGIWLRAG
jgi:hypothetical protein